MSSGPLSMRRCPGSLGDESLDDSDDGAASAVCRIDFYGHTDEPIPDLASAATTCRTPGSIVVSSSQMVAARSGGKKALRRGTTHISLVSRLVSAAHGPNWSCAV